MSVSRASVAGRTHCLTLDPQNLGGTMGYEAGEFDGAAATR